MNNILFILLLVVIFTFILKPIENMTVNFKCEKNNNNYLCKEEDTFSSVNTILNELLTNYKETAQNKYKKFKETHDAAQNELEQHFGKVET